MKPPKKRSNYAIGRQFEYKVMKALTKMGAYHLVRSASSKGLFDIVAFFPDGEVWGVQCKKNRRLGKAEREQLQEFINNVKNVKVLHAYDIPNDGVGWEGIDGGTRENT